MIQRNLQLMQRWLLQVLGQQPDNTVVLGVQQAGAPIPIWEPGHSKGSFLQRRRERPNSY